MRFQKTSKVILRQGLNCRERQFTGRLCRESADLFCCAGKIERLLPVLNAIMSRESQGKCFFWPDCGDKKTGKRD